MSYEYLESLNISDWWNYDDPDEELQHGSDMEVEYVECDDYATTYYGTLPASAAMTLPPSVHTASKWIHEPLQQSQNQSKGGKWMVFVPTERVDDAWDKIKLAVRQGKLGNAAHVSTKAALTGKYFNIFFQREAINIDAISI